MKQKTKQKRPYRRITAETVAKHKAVEHIAGNGTRAVEMITPDHRNPGNRAYRIRKKEQNIPTLAYLDDTMQQIAADAVRELGELIHTDDVKERGRNVRYAIDHVRGKAVTKSIAITGKLNIQSVLD